MKIVVGRFGVVSIIFFFSSSQYPSVPFVHSTLFTMYGSLSLGKYPSGLLGNGLPFNVANKFNCTTSGCTDSNYNNIGLLTTYEYNLVGGLNSYLANQNSFFSLSYSPYVFIYITTCWIL